ncbi:MAG: oligosaccharide flippase family protein [Clostridia bacterium]|nr:oligosaccharide flippase family protein [Clostridia bacterium]
MNSSKQIKYGAIMSYFTIVFNMVAGLIYTPWMIEQIGQSNYGLYTLATSLITLFVVDFGMGAAVARFVSKYNAEGKQDKINNFLGVVYKLYMAIDAVILVVLLVIGLFISGIYSNLTPAELETFKVLYVIVGLFSIISFPFTNLNGVLTAYELFVGLKVADLFHKLFIIFIMVIALLLGYGVYALVIVNAIAGLLTIAIKLIIIKKKTSVKVNFKYRDKELLKEIFGFSVWTTVSSLAQRLIFNITPSIIAAVSITGSIGVSIFGLGQTIEGYVYTFASAISGMFMPMVSRLVYENKREKELINLMIKIGRIQCLIIGLLVTGFIAVGHSFIVDIWNRPEFSDSYLCCIFLIIPSFFHLPMEIANTTLIVENKVKLQSFVYIIMGIINVVLSLILSHYFGALGASISIFIAYMIRTLLLVVIYQKVLKLDMLKFFKETFVKFTPSFLVAMIVGIMLENYNPLSYGFLRFAINSLVFVTAFFVLIIFKLNDYEKNLFFGKIKRLLKR